MELEEWRIAVANMGVDDPMWKLPSRARHALFQHRVFRSEQVAAMSNADLLKIRNFGAVSLAEVRAIIPQRDLDRCPHCAGSGRIVAVAERDPAVRY